MNIQISVSQDQLEAYVTITGEPFPTEQDLRRELTAMGIVYGIDDTVLQKIIAHKRDVEQVTIARGKKPVTGEPARLEWHIGLDDAQKPRIDEHDRADYKQLHEVFLVSRGQTLVSKIPAGNGMDGIAVTGDTIPGTGADILLPQGDNTEISGDGLALMTKINGVATWQQNKLQVDDVYHIRGNVDYHTGNIKYDGPVVIDGDVRSGFRVESTDSIFIGGSVGAAHIYSQSGDIRIKFGILGKGRARVLAGGSLECGFVQDATIGVKQDVSIERYAINSTISAGGKVVLIKNEGLIRGGSITAGLGIVAREVGSQRNLFTELKLRIHGPQSSQITLWEISKKRTDLILRKTFLNNRLSFLAVLKRGIVSLSDERESEMRKIQSELDRLEEKLQQLDHEEIAFQKKISREALQREIKVFEHIYRNVRIDIGGKEFYVDNPLEHVKIYRFRNDVVVESLSDVEDRSYDIFIPST